MSAKLEEYDGVCVVSISGDFAGEEVSTARKAAAEFLENQQLGDCVVDLERTPFVDSDGLEMLLWLKRRCEGLSGQFKLASVDENVRKILELTRLGRKFEIASDVPMALKMMR